MTSIRNPSTFGELWADLEKISEKYAIIFLVTSIWTGTRYFYSSIICNSKYLKNPLRKWQWPHSLCALKSTKCMFSLAVSQDAISQFFQFDRQFPELNMKSLPIKSGKPTSKDSINIQNGNPSDRLPNGYRRDAQISLTKIYYISWWQSRFLRKYQRRCFHSEDIINKYVLFF